MRVLPFAFPVIMLTALWRPAPAQSNRLDHRGAAVPRLRAICADRAQGSSRSLHLRSDALVNALNKPDARRDADLWMQLACVDAMVFVDSPLVKVHREMVRPPEALRALNAFKTVSQARPADTVAAIGMAALALEFAESDDVGAIVSQTETLAHAAYDAMRSGVTSPIVIRMCAEFAIGSGDFATARRCIDRGLSQGVDSTWHFEREALLSFLLGNEYAGVAWFEAALAVARDSAAVDDADWRVAWLVDSGSTSTPSTDWRALSDSARMAWLRTHIAHGAANGEDASPYIDRITRTFLTPAFQGPLLQRCPIIVFRNGAEQDADHSACRGDVRPGAPRIELSGQLIRLWHPATGAPVGILGYAVQRRGLRADSGRIDNRIAVAALNVRQYEWETAEWRDTTVRISLPVTNDLANPPVTGFLKLPVFRGTLTWTLGVQQPGRYGAVSTEGSLALAPKGYAVSDLVLGVVEQGLSVPLNGDTIVLAPLNIVKRNRPVELYYQLKADSSAEALRTEVVLHRIVAGRVAEDPAISWSTRTPSDAGINTVHRQLNIAALVGGDYQLDLRIRNAAGREVARRTVNLLVR